MYLIHLGPLIDENHQRREKAMSYVLMPLMLGFLFGPAIPLYMISEEVRPVWAVILVNLVLLSVIVAATWHGVQKMNAAKRAVEPTRQWERLHADRIEIGFADGTVRSLPLHAADLSVSICRVAGCRSTSTYWPRPITRGRRRRS
ncbi:hypothetical protein LX16_4237 [Stackebrandtia albiflava]|uniref:Uncharacterized protein n=1 Tax=Stackebrandtia albiflava TaxID=406432 RepID=A0A562UYZ8_9ACTN|nr:hypothetical protein [Stackebrandtia albiflava]TWJ10813.1 hypothetical protein LX16_4237 [Stackebrandtia albiflava]